MAEDRTIYRIRVWDEAEDESEAQEFRCDGLVLAFKPTNVPRIVTMLQGPHSLMAHAAALLQLNLQDAVGMEYVLAAMVQAASHPTRVQSFEGGFPSEILDPQRFNPNNEEDPS